MSAEIELLRAYRDWHRLALAESKAIQTRNWSLLSDCHLAIKDYQTVVARLTREARAEWKRTSRDLAEKERNLHVLVSDLMELTRQNQERLQSMIANARQKLGDLGEAGKNLRLLRRSYGFVATGSRAL